MTEWLVTSLKGVGKIVAGLIGIAIVALGPAIPAELYGGIWDWIAMIWYGGIGLFLLLAWGYDLQRASERYNE